MTEPKVVRWTRPGTVTALRIKAGRFECRWDHYPNAGDHRWKDCGPVSIAVTDELARLAARVQELEGHAELYRELAARVDDDENSLVAEITQLREALDSIAVNAKDEFSRVTATAALEEKP